MLNAAMRRICACDFFSAVRSFDPALIARLTQLDYAREMALVAIEPATGDLLGVVRLHGDANHERAEYAILCGRTAMGAASAGR